MDAAERETMSTTQPIRSKETLKQFMDYYQTGHPNARNYAMLVIGLNTALRISDVLKLKWENVYDFKKECFLEHLQVTEHKTGKRNMIALNEHVKAALWAYQMQCEPKPEDYIFSKSTKREKPISRTQAYRIVKKAAAVTTTEENISCHSMRKTFGYHAWKQGTSPVLLMEIYNHSSFDITKRYLGISQDERDSIYLKINL